MDVSIPYRYGTDTLMDKEIKEKLEQVSIPYRYGTDTSINHYRSIGYQKFQFLIGMVLIRVLQQSKPPLTRRRCVSIPYRYGTDTREILNYSSIYLLYSLIYPLL